MFHLGGGIKVKYSKIGLTLSDKEEYKEISQLFEWPYPTKKGLRRSKGTKSKQSRKPGLLFAVFRLKKRNAANEGAKS